ncbi:sensor histidine kinase [Butyrivibrio sp. MC2013]|uniref:sensor histidine kinase n=1 Tax=Butyrivibrio sp. MC2013 TaxID=1280686 RepID=UPI00041A171E|nr:sensor histidine kinase [Butyrivibrio sp. MC2013]
MDDPIMRLFRKSRFLSGRILAFLSSFFLLMMVICIICDGYEHLSVIVMSVLFLYLFIFIFAIARPFLRNENKIRRMINGYMVFEPSGSQGTVLTPATEEMSDTIYTILNSTQTVNLNKRQAQYLALQNQINPHFLYNTLDGIRSEALIAGLDTVADMTEALATFFRYTISNVENLVTIDEELDNCRTYFKIQQYRFGDRIGLEIDEKGEDLGSLMIPKLTLQPILENSIIHGTEMKIGKGLTTICIERTDMRIKITISDDGVGMDEDTLARLNRRLDMGGESLRTSEKESGGIALVNVNNRIHLLFGQEYGLHVFSIKNIGTSVEISIPAVSERSELAREAAGGK